MSLSSHQRQDSYCWSWSWNWNWRCSPTSVENMTHWHACGCCRVIPTNGGCSLARPPARCSVKPSFQALCVIKVYLVTRRDPSCSLWWNDHTERGGWVREQEETPNTLLNTHPPPPPLPPTHPIPSHTSLTLTAVSLERYFYQCTFWMASVLAPSRFPHRYRWLKNIAVLWGVAAAVAATTLWLVQVFFFFFWKQSGLQCGSPQNQQKPAVVSSSNCLVP